LKDIIESLKENQTKYYGLFYSSMPGDSPTMGDSIIVKIQIIRIKNFQK